MGKNITVRVGDSLQNFQDVNITRFNEVGGGLAQFVNPEQLSEASNIHIIPYYPESIITDAQKQEIIQALTLLKEDEGEFSVFIKRSKSIIPATYTIISRTVVVYGTDHDVSNPRTYRISLHTNGTLTVSDEAFYVYDIGGIDDDTKAPVGSVVAGYVQEYVKEHGGEGGGGIAQETDPTVPAWAKEPTKPSYTAKEVGALPDTYTPPDQTAEQVGADPKGTADAKVSAHNVSNNSHNDIRLLIEGLASRLNTLADSTDEDLDQLSEVVAYIKANKSLIDSITTSKVSVSDIINNLTTNVSTKPLSAAQGVALKALIDAITVPTKLSQLSGDTTHRTVTDAEKTAWNAKSNFSGAYADLTGKPTIPTVPTNISAFNNDAGYIKDVDLDSAVDDALTEAKESGEFDGADGERGTGILKITTAPSAYTTATGGFTPAYRIALSTVLTQSKASKVLVGDTIAYNYYQYPVGYVDSSYVYVGARTSVRGATGATGETGPAGKDGKDSAYILADGETLEDAPADVDVVIDPNGEGADCIYAPEKATVGQTIVVKAVDANGKPTEWEAVDFPEGGGASSWNDLTDKPFGLEYIGGDTLTVDFADIIRQVEEGTLPLVGNAFIKVSDTILKTDDFAGGCFLEILGQSYYIPPEEIPDMIDELTPNSFAFWDGILSVGKQDVGVDFDEGLVFNEAGLYMAVLAEEGIFTLTLPNFNGFVSEQLKLIDEKYIPHQKYIYTNDMKDGCYLYEDPELTKKLGYADLPKSTDFNIAVVVGGAHYVYMKPLYVTSEGFNISEGFGIVGAMNSNGFIKYYTAEYTPPATTGEE